MLVNLMLFFFKVSKAEREGKGFVKPTGSMAGRANNITGSILTSRDSLSIVSSTARNSRVVFHIVQRRW